MMVIAMQQHLFATITIVCQAYISSVPQSPVKKEHNVFFSNERY
jgi:hypothetical protein